MNFIWRNRRMKTGRIKGKIKGKPECVVTWLFTVREIRCKCSLKKIVISQDFEIYKANILSISVEWKGKENNGYGDIACKKKCDNYSENQYLR